jgi:RHS repeat-associated protein
MLGPVLSVLLTAGVLTAVPVAVVAAGHAPAKAAGVCSGSVLVFPDSVNGGSSSAEAAEAAALGCSVTMFSSSAVSGMTQAQMEAYFGGFSAILVGDPSTSASCSSTVPADALAYAADWGPAVKGNVVVLGTAPVAAGSSGTQFLDDAITYAVTGGASGNTGLYASLDCDYSSAPAGTAVPLLAGVGGGGFTVTGQGAHCPGDAGTPNRLQVVADGPFNGLTAANLGPWSSPACSVQETLTAFTGGLSGLAYDAAATPATFTASDGATGQAYIVAGTLPTAGTQELAPSQGGEVPAQTTAGGANPADPGVAQATAGDPVNTENGDFTQSDTDLSVATYGPSLDFTRSYDGDVAQQQTQTGSPGAMGYGWTDNWATSLTPGRPVQGDIYTLAGLRTAYGDGAAPASTALDDPQGVTYNGGNMYFADSSDGRIEEVAGSTGSQWGISMTAGDTYTIAAQRMNGEYVGYPGGIAFDSAGDLFFADTGNNRVEEIPATSKTQWNIPMTAFGEYTVAGNAEGAAGSSGDGGVATAAYLSGPKSIAFDSAGDLFIADSGNNRVQEVAAASGSQWKNGTMTANDIYTVAGSASGTSGNSANGTGNTSSLLDDPRGVAVNATGLYVADTGNCKVVLFPKTAGTYWNITMAQYEEYAVAGKGPTACGAASDKAAASASDLDAPAAITVATNIYIADAGSNQVQEVASAGHTEFGTSMAANDIYDIAGVAAGTPGYSGDGGAAGSAEMNDPVAVTLDGSGNLYIADADNSRIREVNASTDDISTYAGDGYTMATAGDGGPATQGGLNDPMQEAFDARGDVYIADAANNRIQEIASYSHTQYGIAMTAGDVYTIAGQADGQAGCQCDGGPATAAFLDHPTGIAVDPAGDLFIADSGNNRIQEVPNVGGLQWGQSMTAGDMYTIAGNQYGTEGYTGDGGPASAALLGNPVALALDTAGDIYIADTWNNRIQEMYASGGQNWGNTGWTAGDIYTVAGSATAAQGDSGDGGAATSALLNAPTGVFTDAAGDLFIADMGNNRIREVPPTSGTSYGQTMTAASIYTIAGGTWGTPGDGGPATAASIEYPQSIAVDSSGDVYYADSGNNRIQEIAAANGTQWGQSMTADNLYTVAGSAAGTSGNAGDGALATAALMANTESISLDPEGDLYITDNTNDTIREVAAAIPAAIPPAPGQTSSLALAPTGNAPAGLTITQPDGAQVTFWAQTGGSCASPYVATGSYCILPQNQGATLSYNSGTQIYTFSAAPGSGSYTYTSSGQLTSQTDTAGDTLNVTYHTPAPGAGQCPSTASSCNTVTSASGRALVIGLNAGGLVTTVTDPMGRTWTYAYTGSDLTSVTDPLADKTTYTYGAGTTGNPLLANDLLTITSPNAQPGGPDAGNATVNVYNPSGQVTTQTDPMGHTTTLSYTAMNTATGTGIVTVADPDGNTAIYDYTQGALAATSEWTGTTLTSEQDDTPDTTASTTANPSGGTMLDTTTTNGDGDTSSYTYNSSGSTTSVTAPDGVGSQTGITTTQYTTLNDDSCDGTTEASTSCSSSETGPSPVAPGGVVTPPSSAPPEGVTYTLYDTDGNQLYQATGVYSPTGTYQYSQTTYQLFKGNSVTLGSTNITCTYTPPSQSLPCVRINADGVVTQLEYNAQGDLISSATPDGNGSQIATTTDDYDADGEQTSEVAPDGNLSGANAGNYTTVTVYNADGQQISATQAGGSAATFTPRVTAYGYDADGNQTTVKDPRGYTTTTTYNADDEPTLVTDPDGNATLTCYDGDHNTTQTVPPPGVAANSLAPASCPVSYPAGYADRLASDATTWTFDANGHQTETTTPAPAGQTGYETTTFTYDADGNLTKTTGPPASNAQNAPNEVTYNSYNSADELATQTTGYGTSAASTTSYCYDPNGDQTAIVAPDGNTSATAECETSFPWVISASAYPTQAAYQTTESYDSSSELVSTTSPATSAAPLGATTSYTYDAAGNKLTSTDPNNVTTTWTYTPVGRPATISYSGSSAHSVSYSYDASGNKTAMSDATGSSSYIYDPFGELTSAQNGAGQTIGYGYDADGNITGITYPLPATATWANTDTASYGYDEADVLDSVTDFNGHQIAITNNGYGLPSSETLGSTGDTVSFTYDQTSAPSAVTLKNSSAALQSFSDADAPSGAVLTETDTPASSGSPVNYTYDTRGKIASMTPGTNATLNYSFDASTNLTTLPTGASGTYDYAGELTSSALAGTTTSYTYNADGQRVTAKQSATTIASGSWNGASELTAYANTAASMTSVVYDASGLRASATVTPAGGSASSQVFTWDTATQAPQLLMDSANVYIYATGNAPVEQVNLSTGSISYLNTDMLGSVRGVVNSAGSLVATTSYDAWGNPQTTGGLASSTPFGYAGGYTDSTGLIYLINRYYDPATGQFLSVDPQVSQTKSAYGYAAGNPVTITDPTGLAPNCGPGVGPRKLVASYKMKRVGSGGYRQAPLYCGNSAYGYRHLAPHVGPPQYWGNWSTFDKSIWITLLQPDSIVTQDNGNYRHYKLLYQCVYDADGYAYFYPWPFYVITNIKSATIINAYAGRRKGRINMPCDAVL